MSLIYYFFYFLTIEFRSQLRTTNVYYLIDRLSVVPSCATEATSGSTNLMQTTARLIIKNNPGTFARPVLGRIARDPPSLTIDDAPSVWEPSAPRGKNMQCIFVRLFEFLFT
jgi:hypothetical protein